MQKTNRLISELLLQSHGIDVTKFDDTFLNKSLQKRIAETNCDSDNTYCKLLLKNKKEGEILLNSLSNSYTEFFRNPLTFAVLGRIVLPSIVLKNANSRRKEIRIWSAACAAGQESYSLAILLEELKNGDNAKIIFRIFATDQDEAQINEAKDGKYPLAALNNVNLSRANQWFVKNEDTFTVRQELRKNIDFSVFDLFNGQYGCPPASIFGDFELIICANLLFYYKPEFQNIMIEKAKNSLTNGGYLITGETERDILMKHNFREVFPHSAIFQKMERG